jgi:lysozyme family protein
MQSIHEIASDIVAREGGFVNDPDDPGGATKYGVTIHTMRRLGLDLDGDGDVDVADVRKLSRDSATQIFIDHYFQRSKIAQLPQVLQASVFDMNVNAGANSVKILQRLVAVSGFALASTVRLVPQTIAAVRQATQSAPDHIGDAYGIERRNYY